MKHLMKKAVKAAVFATLTTLALTAFASAEGEMAIGAGCTTGTSLRMRSEPNTSSAIVTTLNKSVAVALLDDSVPGWYKINYNGSTGYVSSDYLIIDQDNIFTTYGRVPEGTVNVRAAATTESESLATIDAGTVVTVNGLVNGWYDVTCQYGTEGYVRSDLLVLTSNATSGKGSSIVETALSHLGTRYVYGGASAGGFDCSGFVSYCLTGSYSRLGSTYTFLGWSEVYEPQPGDILENARMAGALQGLLNPITCLCLRVPNTTAHQKIEPAKVAVRSGVPAAARLPEGALRLRDVAAVQRLHRLRVPSCPVFVHRNSAF